MDVNTTATAFIRGRHIASVEEYMPESKLSILTLHSGNQYLCACSPETILTMLDLDRAESYEDKINNEIKDILKNGK